MTFIIDDLNELETLLDLRMTNHIFVSKVFKIDSQFKTLQIKGPFMTVILSQALFFQTSLQVLAQVRF